MALKKFSEFINDIDEGLIGNIGSGLWQGGRQIATGVGTGVKHFNNSVNGPGAKFAAAVDSINGLIQMVSKNPAFTNLPGSPGSTLSQDLTKIVQYLQKQQAKLPQMTTQTQTGWQNPVV